MPISTKPIFGQVQNLFFRDAHVALQDFLLHVHHFLTSLSREDVVHRR